MGGPENKPVAAPPPPPPDPNDAATAARIKAQQDFLAGAQGKRSTMFAGIMPLTGGMDSQPSLFRRSLMGN